jgi:hypothetical protein
MEVIVNSKLRLKEYEKAAAPSHTKDSISFGTQNAFSESLYK